MSRCYCYCHLSILLLFATRPSCTALAFNLPLFASNQRQPTKIFSIDISEAAPRDIAPLLQWSSDAGIQYDLTLTAASPSDDGKGEDVYAVATHDTPASSCVLYVPPQVMLSTKNAAQPFDNSAAQLHPGELPAESCALTWPRTRPPPSWAS